MLPHPLLKSKGFTLIETLVALSILTVTIGGLITLSAISIKALGAQKDKQLAVKIATEGMEWVRNKRDNNVRCLTNQCVDISQWTDNLIGTWKIDAAFPQRLLSNQALSPYTGPGDYICIEDNSGSKPGKFIYCGNNPNKVLPQHFDRRVQVADLGSNKVQVQSTVTWNSRTAGTQTLTLTEVLYGRIPSRVPGVAACWFFDEGSGNIAFDSSPNGNDGALVNNPFRTTGRFGRALQFNGLDTFVDVGAPTSLADIEIITISAWIKLNSYGENSLGRIVDKRGAYRTPPQPGGWVLLVDNFDVTQGLGFNQDFNVAGTWVGARWAVSSSIELGQWYHVAVSYDSTSLTNEPIFYINGAIPSNPVTTFEPPAGSRTSDAATSLLIGTDTPLRHFDGLIDDVCIYKRILSPTEISAIYNGA